MVYVGPSLLKHFVIDPYKSYIKHLPGPKRRGIFTSDYDFVSEATECKESNERLAHEYGLNVRIQGFGYQDQRLMTFDSVTINYILGSAADRFPKSLQTRRFISKLTGCDMSLKGMNVTEGPYHHRLRKVIAPAFAPSALRVHAYVFISKANELCDHWRSILAEPTAPVVSGVENDSQGGILLDVNNWSSRLSLDVIGLAAFGYSFNSVREDSNKLFGAYMRLQDATREGVGLRAEISLSWPWLEPFLGGRISNIITESAQVVRETSKVILKEMQLSSPEGDSKTILGLLLRSNAEATPEDRLSNEELLSQIDSFIFAGSDSTGLSITWALYELARSPEIQQALRAELQPLGLRRPMSESDISVSDHAAQFAAIDALPLLDAIVREVLRLRTPVQATLRIAEEDDIVPFSLDSPPKMPDGSISSAVVTGVGADGVKRTGIRVRKGDFIHIPLESMNSIRDVWGDDGHKFDPGRWANLPVAAKGNPGVITGLATFSVGPHSCPAFRFAMAEIKITIAYVVASFTLEESFNILPHYMMVSRPYVEDQESKGTRLPLRVRAV